MVIGAELLEDMNDAVEKAVSVRLGIVKDFEPLLTNVVQKHLVVRVVGAL